MRYSSLLSAAVVAASLVLVGCSNSPQSSGDGMTPMPANGGGGTGGGAVVGTPGATTGPSAGYDPSDPSHYHPGSDDTNKYRPSDPNTVRQQSGQ